MDEAGSYPSYRRPKIFSLDVHNNKILHVSTCSNTGEGGEHAWTTWIHDAVDGDWELE